LAEALSPLLSEEDTLLALQLYDSEFEKSYLNNMRLKLGLCKEEEDDSDLIESLLDTMHETGCDFTNVFHCLSRVGIPDSPDSIERVVEEVVEAFLEECASPQQLVQSYRPKMPPHQLHMFQQLMETAPEVLQALGLRPESLLQQEIAKMQNMDKLKGDGGGGGVSPGRMCLSSTTGPVQQTKDATSSAAHVPAADGDGARGAAGSGSET
jgi:uncharacterized protein YdiU (UPF0061 family)